MDGGFIFFLWFVSATISTVFFIAIYRASKDVARIREILEMETGLREKRSPEQVEVDINKLKDKLERSKKEN